MSSNKPIYSMTGFGRAAKIAGLINISVECRSVNSRYLEINCKLPRLYSQYEAELRQLSQSYVSRGRVDLIVSRKIDLSIDPDKSQGSLEEKFSAVSAEIQREFEEFESRFLSLGISLDNQQRYDIAKHVLSSSAPRQQDEVLSDSEIVVLKEAVTEALEELQNQRKDEARRLSKDLSERLLSIFKDLEELTKKAVDNPRLIRERVSERIKSAVPASIIEDSRLMQEIVLLIDKTDVTEELVRLRAHLELFNDALKSGGLLGKRLDFICQEIFRELNTLGGKSACSAIQALVVNCKVELERIREQVQNFE